MERHGPIARAGLTPVTGARECPDKIFGTANGKGAASSATSSPTAVHGPLFARADDECSAGTWDRPRSAAFQEWRSSATIAACVVLGRDHKWQYYCSFTLSGMLTVSASRWRRGSPRGLRLRPTKLSCVHLSFSFFYEPIYVWPVLCIFFKLNCSRLLCFSLFFIIIIHIIIN